MTIRRDELRGSCPPEPRQEADRLEISRDEQANHRFKRVFVRYYLARVDERQGGSEVPGGAQFLDFGKIAGKHGVVR
jgi:hypothetical protein